MGTPVQLVDIAGSIDQSDGGTYAIARDGSLVYMKGEAATSVVWIDRNGTTTTALVSDANLRNPRLAPDGKRVALNGTAVADVWVFDFDRGSRLRLTTAGFNRGSVWSPDGERVAFFSLPDSPQPGVDTQDLYEVRRQAVRRRGCSNVRVHSGQIRGRRTAGI